MENRTIGNIAYDAYRISSGGKSLVSGQNLPDFEQLTPRIMEAWEAAADAVAAAVGRADARCDRV